VQDTDGEWYVKRTTPTSEGRTLKYHYAQSREEAIANALDVLNSETGGTVPDAPFRQSHLRLFARRVIRWAAERGINKIPWTTGEQQAERRSLKQVADEFRFDGESLHLYRRASRLTLCLLKVPNSYAIWLGQNWQRS
jgi:hypothetical protein